MIAPDRALISGVPELLAAGGDREGIPEASAISRYRMDRLGLPESSTAGHKAHSA